MPAKNNRTAPVQIAVKVEAPKGAPVPEPETILFAAKLADQVRKAYKPVFTKKLQALKDEYATAAMDVEEAFAKERIDLEVRYTAVRNKNKKEFLEKVQILKDTYKIC